MHLFRDERSRKAIEVAEKFAEGEATGEELAVANAASEALLDWDSNVPYWDGQWAIHPLAKMAALASRRDAFEAAWLVRQMISDIRYFGGADDDYPKAKLEAADKDLERFCSLLCCVFGNPFRPMPPIPAAVLAWNDGTVRRIVEGIYEEGAFDRLPTLADALLDAGCDNEELMAHCRSEGPHVRGCWAVDLILGKS
jgi:hypothetical protein